MIIDLIVGFSTSAVTVVMHVLFMALVIRVMRQQGMKGITARTPANAASARRTRCDVIGICLSIRNSNSRPLADRGGLLCCCMALTAFMDRAPVILV
jgi:hypothetical protein